MLGPSLGLGLRPIAIMLAHNRDVQNRSGRFCRTLTRILILTLAARQKSPPRLRSVSFFVWWRRRESNPRPQALCRRLYMLIPNLDLTVCYPSDWKNTQRFRYLFSASPPDEDPSRFHESDARVWTHGHGSSRTAPYRVLSGECVVVVVGNYKFAGDLTSFPTFSACTSGFATHVEARSSPERRIIPQGIGDPRNFNLPASG